MADLILHHYDTSPFSEKVKKLLAHKGVAWRAVEQPTIMPKPQLLPLTGGYRRIPVLQIGADVYCDSQLIARVLERLHPEPTLYPGGSEGACHAFSLWADRMFFLATVPLLFALIGEHVPQAFIDDRSKLMGGRADFAEVPKQAPMAREHCRADAALLEAQLADGRPFLFGQQFSLADAACYHPVWFLRNFPGAADVFNEFPRLLAWADRVQAMGQGPTPGHGSRRGPAYRQAEHARNRAPRRRIRAERHRSRHARRGRTRRLRFRPGRGRGGDVGGARDRAAAQRSGSGAGRGALSAHRISGAEDCVTGDQRR